MSSKKPSMYQEAHFTGRYSRNTLGTLWFAYKPFLGRISLAMILGLLGRTLLLGNMNLIGLWVDTLSSSSSKASTVPWVKDWGSKEFIWALLGMSILGFTFTIAYRILFSRTSANAISVLYDETTLRTSRFPMRFFDMTPVGRIVTRFSSDYGNIFRLFGGPLAEFGAIIFDLLAMITLVTVASPFYLPIIAFVCVLNLVIYKLNQNRLRTARRELSASRSPSIAHFAETAQGASTIRSFLKEGSFTKRFFHLDSFYLNKKIEAVKTFMLFSFQMNLMTALLLLLTGFVAYSLHAKNLVSVGSIGVAFSFIALSGNTVQMFFEWMSQFEEAMVGVERLDQYLRAPLEPGGRLPLQAQFLTEHPFEEPRKEKIHWPKNCEIRFDNVNFRYDAELPYVLQDVNLVIKAGEKVGIVGKTGSGKSTLIQALFHFYPLTSGEISINGYKPETSDKDTHSTDRIPLPEFRRALAFISQDPILFAGTLHDNIDLLRQCTNERIFTAFRQVGLEHWANEKSLRMQIEEKGRNLSVGERQLICLIRCLLQDAPVVIMDEATSSIDPQTEEMLGKANEKFFREKTQIIIAHRLSTLKKCDRIVWISKGRIFKVGPPEVLLSDFEKAQVSI